MAYTTSALQTIVSNLEASLATGTAKITFEGHELEYRSVADIMTAIVYFKTLFPCATDAPPVTKRKVRLFYPFTNKGFRT